MAQATLSVRMNQADKRHFEKFCKAAGLNASVAVNMFIKAVIKHQRIPFDVEGDPFYSERNIERIRKAVSEIERGHYTFHEPVEVEQ